MKTQICHKSKSTLGFQIITVIEFVSGRVMMYVDDIRSFIQEEIALKTYIDAYEITYDFDQGWMAGGSEIPYLESF